MPSVRFSGVDSDEEEKRATRGWEERKRLSKERKRIKEQRKEAMAELAMAEQARIRLQVRQFLAHLGDMENQDVRDCFDSLQGDLKGNLRRMHGEDDFRVCVERFIETFVNPGNAVDLNEWQTVTLLQIVMMNFSVSGLYQDPAPAAPGADEAELTSNSSDGPQ